MNGTILPTMAGIGLVTVLLTESCTTPPSIDVGVEIAGLEQLVSTTDTIAVRRYLSERGVVVEKSGGSPLYEYYVVGKKPGFELEYHLSPMGVGGLVIMGVEQAVLNALRLELENRGYTRGDDSRESEEILHHGEMKELDVVFEHYHRPSSDASFDFWIRTLQDDGDVVDFAFGVNAPRRGRLLMSNGVARTAMNIIVGDEHFYFDNQLADTTAFSLLRNGLGPHSRTYKYSESEGPITEMIKRSRGLPKVIDKSDAFVYDTLGLRIGVNREAGRLSSMVVFLKGSDWDYAPRQPFQGNLIINGHYINHETKLVDLLNWGIGQVPADNNALQSTFETSNGTFDLTFSFDLGAMTMTRNRTTYTGDGALKEVEIHILRNDAHEVRPR